MSKIKPCKKGTKKYEIKRWDMMNHKYNVFSVCAKSKKDILKTWGGATLYSIKHKNKEIYLNPYA